MGGTVIGNDFGIHGPDGERVEGAMATVIRGASSGLADEAGPHAHEPHEPERAPATPSVHPPHTVLTDAGDLLRALAAPVRIAIVLQLREADRCVHELVDALDVAQPLISQHLRVLKTAGVVQGERRGREVVYGLADDHLAHIVVDAVAHVQEGK
jgi:DNA-binding transcriptional ArsR family regulator